MSYCFLPGIRKLPPPGYMISVWFRPTLKRSIMAFNIALLTVCSISNRTGWGMIYHLTFNNYILVFLCYCCYIRNIFLNNGLSALGHRKGFLLSFLPHSVFFLLLLIKSEIREECVPLGSLSHSLPSMDSPAWSARSPGTAVFCWVHIVCFQ